MLKRLFAILCLAVTSTVLAGLYVSIPSVTIKNVLSWATLVALGAYFLSSTLIPRLQEFLARKGLKGKDLGRKGTKDEDTEMYAALPPCLTLESRRKRYPCVTVLSIVAAEILLTCRTLTQPPSAPPPPPSAPPLWAWSSPSSS